MIKPSLLFEVQSTPLNWDTLVPLDLSPISGVFFY